MAQPAKSAKLQLLNGNPNKKNVDELKRRAEQEEKMKMANDNILPPSWLDAEGKKAFNTIKKELITIDLIANVDTHFLAVYADSYAKYVAMNKKIAKDGLQDEEGNPHPLLVRMEKQATQMRSFGGDLGLSPSARAKLAIKLAEDDANDEDDY